MRKTTVRKHKRSIMNGQTNVVRHTRRVNKPKNIPQLNVDLNINRKTLKQAGLNFIQCVNDEFDKLVSIGVPREKALAQVSRLYKGLPVRVVISSQRGFIIDLAKKASLGLKNAIEWESQHLPSQSKWVKKEYKKAKKQFGKAWDKAVEFEKENLPAQKKFLRSASQAPSQLLKKIYDFNQKLRNRDVIDKLETDNERDHDDDGRPDITNQELDVVNANIRQNLKNIDTNKNGVPDTIELKGGKSDTDGDGLPDNKERLISTIVKPESRLDKYLQRVNASSKVRSRLGQLVATSPVSDTVRLLQDNPKLIQDISDQRLKILAVRAERPIFFRGYRDPVSELKRRQKNKKRLSRAGL